MTDRIKTQATSSKPMNHKQTMIHQLTRLFNANKQLAERQRLHALTIAEVYAEYRFSK